MDIRREKHESVVAVPRVRRGPAFDFVFFARHSDPELAEGGRTRRPALDCRRSLKKLSHPDRSSAQRYAAEGPVFTVALYFWLVILSAAKDPSAIGRANTAESSH